MEPLDLNNPKDKQEFLEALKGIHTSLERLSETNREMRESLQIMSENLDSATDIFG